MHKRASDFLYGLLVGLLFLPVHASCDDMPARTVEAFYRFHLAHNTAFTLESVESKAQWFTPHLMQLLRGYFQRPQSSEEPPSISGDPFTDSQEYPASFRITSVELLHTKAIVRLQFPLGTRFRVVWVLVSPCASRWCIAELRYENGLTLSTLLTRKP